MEFGQNEENRLIIIGGFGQNEEIEAFRQHKLIHECKKMRK